jgi:hypothetical protein
MGTPSPGHPHPSASALSSVAVGVDPPHHPLAREPGA